MPKEFNISRRKALAALGTIGVASAGAGVGTTAYFNDTESFANNEVQAGELNLKVGYTVSVDQGGVATSNDQGTASSPQDGSSNTGTIDGNPANYSYNIYDAKPGDSGRLEFCPTVESNPGFVWATAELTENSDPSLTEPEKEVDSDDGQGNGELAENITAKLKYKNGPQIYPDSGSTTLKSLINWLADGNTPGGRPIDFDPDDGESDVDAFTAGSEKCVVLDWNIDTTVGNVIQNDRVGFDIKFAAVQERHNSGNASPFANS